MSNDFPTVNSSGHEFLPPELPPTLWLLVPVWSVDPETGDCTCGKGSACLAPGKHPIAGSWVDPHYIPYPLRDSGLAWVTFHPQAEQQALDNLRHAYGTDFRPNWGYAPNPQ